MALTSSEVNYLVYRYLQESGFKHSSFTFANESLICKSDFSDAEVAPGALVSFLQKGLQYMELEAHAREDGTEMNCDERFSLLRPHMCKARSKEASAATSEKIREIRWSDVCCLVAHTAEVFTCAWNPKFDVIASGSGDSTVRVWKIPEGRCRSSVGESVSKNAKLLRHGRTDIGDGTSEGQAAASGGDKNSKGGKEKKKASYDVTTLDWNPDGVRMATGSYDGKARIFSTSKDDALFTLSGHEGPVFSIKWNPKGTLLVSGSADMCAIVWEGRTGEIKQKWSLHNAPVLDVDWRDHTTFASCSADKTILLCRVGKDSALTTWEGHKDEINTVRWDPSRSMLASCSDDTTAKIWTTSDSEKCFRSFELHTKEIYSVRWSPAATKKSSILATASFDNTVRIWDVMRDTCLHALSKHSYPVYSVNFSPDGDFLASGSYDQNLFVWSVSTGALVRTYKGKGGIFEVSWNHAGDKIAACFSDSTLCVVDFKRTGVKRYRS